MRLVLRLHVPRAKALALAVQQGVSKESFSRRWGLARSIPSGKLFDWLRPQHLRQADRWDQRKRELRAQGGRS